ncbi:hypothetical protein ACO0QE_000725 [Hanseniaspora vineae]
MTETTQQQKSLYFLRKYTALSLLLLYAFIGLPVWYKLTSVPRAELPVEYIKSLHHDKHQDIHLVIPVYINVRDAVYNFPDLADAVQVQVDHVLMKQKWDVDWTLQVLPLTEEVSDMNDADEYIVQLELDDNIGCSLLYDKKTTIVFFNDESVASNDLPYFIAQSLMEHTFKDEVTMFQSSSKKSFKTKQIDKNALSLALEYSPDVHIAISLLTGTGSPVFWDIDAVLQEFFTPFRKMLAPVVNFTVDTDIVYYNDLNLHKLNEHFSESNNSHVHISTIVDLSELTSKNNYYPGKTNVLNLAIVFPEKNLPAKAFISYENGKLNTTTAGLHSFLIPQWGSLFVNEKPLPSDTGNKLTYEYLKPIIYKFSDELFQLLGLLQYKSELSTPLLTIDSFKRKTTIFNNIDKSVDTLMSLVEMTEKLQEMAIPEQVAQDTERALNLRLQIIDEFLNNPTNNDWNTPLQLSNEMKTIVERAFFHKDMVQENFVPQEHKIAVYLPLLGPITVVCLSGVLKLVKEKRSNKNEREDDDTKAEPKEGSNEKEEVK